MANTKSKQHKQNYGIAEWYGKLYRNLDSEMRSAFAAEKSKLGAFPCPFLQDVPPLGPVSGNLNCKKRGGVCSIRNFHALSPTDDLNFGPITTTCPNRFLEDGTIIAHIGERILGCQKPNFAKEIPFLKRPKSLVAKASVDDLDAEQQSVDELAGLIDKEDVGKIDLVLVDPSDSENWCAVEIQAVYFSGAKMSDDIAAITNYAGNGIPMPGGVRRPDFRSSGPKRLMPQLMIKVPTLRRWGKKMAVVVDQAFFDAMDPMESESDISNSDIVWVVVDFTEQDGSNEASLFVANTVFSTLEEAVKALTAGRPTTLDDFEQKLTGKARALWP